MKYGCLVATIYGPSVLWTLAATASTATPPILQAYLNAAFAATFGSPPPITGAIGPEDRGERPDLWPIGIRTVSLAPDRLLSVGGSRWALVVKEPAQNANGYAGHSTPGALTDAYLIRVDTWEVEHVWPEIKFGVFGEAGNADTKVYQFGGSPLHLATNEWCGMGSCSDYIVVVSLDPSGPRLLGDFEGGAAYPADPDPQTSIPLADPIRSPWTSSHQVRPPPYSGLSTKAGERRLADSCPSIISASRQTSFRQAARLK